MHLDNMWLKYCQRNLQSVAVGIYLLSDFAAKNQLVLPWQLMPSSETHVGRLQHT